MSDITATHAKIKSILFNTYGENEWSRVCANALAAKIAADDFDSRGREYAVMLMCWDWFPGGTTAQTVAERIEEALS